MTNKQFLLTALLIVTLCLAVGCATIEGIGTDLQDGSRAAREYMAEK